MIQHKSLWNNETELTDVMMYRVHLVICGIRTHNVSSDNTDCICSCKSNCHMIMTTTDLISIGKIQHTNIYSKPTTAYANPKIRVMIMTCSKYNKYEHKGFLKIRAKDKQHKLP